MSQLAGYDASRRSSSGSRRRAHEDQDARIARVLEKLSGGRRRDGPVPVRQGEGAQEVEGGRSRTKCWEEGGGERAVPRASRHACDPVVPAGAFPRVAVPPMSYRITYGRSVEKAESQNPAALVRGTASRARSKGGAPHSHQGPSQSCGPAGHDIIDLRYSRPSSSHSSCSDDCGSAAKSSESMTIASSPLPDTLEYTSRSWVMPTSS